MRVSFILVLAGKEQRKFFDFGNLHTASHTNCADMFFRLGLDEEKKKKGNRTADCC